METSRTPCWSLLGVSKGPEETIRRSWDHQRVSEGSLEATRGFQKALRRPSGSVRSSSRSSSLSDVLSPSHCSLAWRLTLKFTSCLSGPICAVCASVAPWRPQPSEQPSFQLPRRCFLLLSPCILGNMESQREKQNSTS